jgi:hypothetical protein
MTSKNLLIVFLIALLSSCKFSKPILTIHHGKRVEVESTTQNTIKIKLFAYLNFRGGVFIGVGNMKKTYNSNGQLIEKQIRKGIRGLTDGNNKHYIKKITYDSLGRISTIYYKIKQYDGRGDTTVYENIVDKTKK